MTGQEENLDSWDGFLGSNFLCADDVQGEDHEFICVGIDLDRENQRPMLDLESGAIKTKWSLNVTNATFVKNAGIKSPKNLIGKKITFKKVLVRNPQTKKEVEGLRIKEIK